MYNGLPDPLLGMAPYENVRRTAQVMSEALCNSNKESQFQIPITA